jgi:rubrerythrin
MSLMSYTLPEFLAHAVAMEEEAAERYLELADMMEAHDNLEVATVFRDMHRFSNLHRDSIRERIDDMVKLPPIKSWQYRWTSPPEVGDEDAFDATMTPFNALTYARENESRAMNFYRSVAVETSDPEVKRLAAEFADEEQEHTEALDDWLERTPRS